MPLSCCCDGGVGSSSGSGWGPGKPKFGLGGEVCGVPIKPGGAAMRGIKVSNLVVIEIRFTWLLSFLSYINALGEIHFHKAD